MSVKSIATFFALCAALAMVLVGAGPLVAQTRITGGAQPRVTIEPRDPQVYDSIHFAVQFNGSLESPSPFPPSSPNLTPLPGIQRQSSFSNISGRSETLTWRFDAIEAGEFYIGPFEVRADGLDITIPEVTGTIRRAPVEGSRLPPEVQDIAGNPNPLASGDRGLARYLTGKAFVVIDVPEKLWVGWPFQASTYVYISQGITGAQERSFNPNNAVGQQFVTIPELSTPHSNIAPRLVQFGSEVFRTYHVHSTTMVPTRAGRTELRSGELRADFLPIGRSMMRMLASIIFEPSRREIDVLPLPPPLDGSHIRVVGNHTIASSVDRTELSEGETITLTIRVSGNGYLEMAALDRMPEIDGLLFVREEVASRINMTMRDEYAADKTFRRTYQATRSGDIVIPPIMMSNFNPRTEEQDLRRTQPIRLTVAAATGTTQVLGNDPTQLPTRADAREIGSGGILHINTSPLDRRAIGATRGASVLMQPWYWILHGVVLLGGLLVASFITWRRFAGSNPETVKAATRKSRVTEALRKAEKAQSADSADTFHSALLDGLMSQVGRNLFREPGGLTAEDAIEQLRQRGTPEGVLADLAQLLEHCHSVRYTPSATSATREQDLQRARSVVRELERVRQ